MQPYLPPRPPQRPSAYPPDAAGRPAPGKVDPPPVVRPGSPSTQYHPGPLADAVTRGSHDQLMSHWETHGVAHPILPQAPAGARPLNAVEHAALEDFKSVYAMRAARFGHIPKFHDIAFSQTYRMENGQLVPNRIQPFPTYEGAVRFPSGAFPPGTVVAVHSVPARGDAALSLPDEYHQARAYRDRTNAYQRPGSHVASHILYQPATGTAFVYDGSLGPRGVPEFHVALPHPGPAASPAPLHAPMPIHPQTAPAPARFLAGPDPSESPALPYGFLPPEPLPAPGTPSAAPSLRREPLPSAPGSVAAHPHTVPMGPAAPEPWEDLIQWPPSRPASPIAATPTGATPTPPAEDWEQLINWHPSRPATPRAP